MERITAAVILAAGDGKRMKSSHPKAACEVLFKPMLSWVIDACLEAGIEEENICVVLSDHAEELLPLLPTGVERAVQSERLGTGHAVLCADSFLKEREEGDVAVLYGDAPLVEAQALREALLFHRKEQNAVTVLSAELADPERYGRIVRRDGGLDQIVEWADATGEELQIREVNSGFYWFDAAFLRRALPQLKDNNKLKEYYLTDVVSLARAGKENAGAFVCPDPSIILGANDRKGLAALNEAARQKVFDRLYGAGVDIPVTDGVMISPDAVIGADTRILPGTIIKGKTVIGTGCEIGPNTLIDRCEIGDGCQVTSSQLLESRMGNRVRFGPFSQLRPGSVIADSVKVGNFVEVKNSSVGEKTSIAHLTYIGDSDLGKGINVGCGVVTVNYDGAKKNRTTIGDNAFIGCNTNLIAPVEVGEGAYVAAATTVTEEVPGGALAIGRVRQQVKNGWAVGKFPKKK